MSQISGQDPRSPQALLFKLCSKITGLKDDELTVPYKVALSSLGSSIACTSYTDEFEVAEKIRKKLVRQGREVDAPIFGELHRKLQSQHLLKNKVGILHLLLKLSEDGSKKNKSASQSCFFNLLPMHANATSTPYCGPARGGGQSQLQLTGASSASSGISSIHGTTTSSDPTPQSIHPSYFQTPGATMASLTGRQPPSTAARVLRIMERHHGEGRDMSVTMKESRSVSTTMSGHQTNKSGDNTSFELPESVLVREVVYTFQGIEGHYVRGQATGNGFLIDPKVGIPRPIRTTVAKLSECGWLYTKIRKYADFRSTDRAFGLVGQSFCAALHQQLTEYHRLISVLEAQVRQEEDGGIDADGSAGLTLRRLRVWTNEPLLRLKALAAMVDVCQGKKGGALASAVHSYIQHGDPSIRALVKHMLTLVAQPVFSTVIQWIYEGELEDTFHEFFAASDPTVKDDRLWHDKYSLRKSMIPSFLTMEQAKKILLTGKSINFLRQVCQDRTTIRTLDVVKAAETKQVETIFSRDLEGMFQRMIDTVYKETSRHLLHVLHTKYQFMEHLKAMRRYLLLGQGDFIRHLMDLLEEDLAKPAGTLFLHNLTGILETAIRATNAQYDHPDILKRLDVRLLEVSPGDTGWDVFSLDYHVDGPIRTVFTQQCMMTYLRVFNFLWRAKRNEYILAGVWKGQMANCRLLRSMPELGGLLHQCHVIGSEMFHFVQQVQYYINFEVLECSWDELEHKVREAEDLDCIIAAHQEFQDTIMTRALLDPQSTAILTQLRTIFDLIIQFQTIQDNMYQTAAEELIHRQCYDDKVASRKQQGEWGVTESDQKEEDKRRAEFRSTRIHATRAQLRVLAQSYQNMVQQFLEMLTSHLDISLRFLSFRLDFNEHYKVQNPKLCSPNNYHKIKRRT